LVFARRLQHGSAAEQGENFLFEHRNSDELGVSTLFGSDQCAAEEMIRGKGFAPNMMKPIALGESPVRAQALRADLVDAISCLRTRKKSCRK
jgi:hypothetical protein